MRFDCLAKIQEVASRTGNRLYHLHFVTSENVLFNVVQIASSVINLVLDSAIEVFEHVEKKKSSVAGDALRVQNRINLKYFCKLVEWVDGVIVSRDDKIFANDEVDLLFDTSASTVQSWKMQDYIGVLVVKLDSWLRRRQK